MCFEYISKATCQSGDSCPHRHVNAAQYQSIKDTKRAGSRSRGSAGVCWFRGASSSGNIRETRGPHGPPIPSQPRPSVVTVSGDTPAIERSLGLDPEDFGEGFPTINEPIGLDPEDFDEGSVPTERPSSPDAATAQELSDASSRASDEQVEDWEEWEAESDVLDAAPMSGIVRFNDIPVICETEAVLDSPMLKYGIPPEMRTQAVIRRYWRPKDRDSWEIRQGYLVRCHATPRRGLFVPEAWGLPEGVTIECVHPMRCTQLLHLTEDREKVSWVQTIRDQWAISGSGGDRVEGWWVGETKFRLEEPPASILEPNTLPSDVLAIARAANARINLCPGEAGISLPVFLTDQVMAIAFPCWDTGEAGDDCLNEGDCFVFVPTQVGVELLAEENLALRRTAYRRVIPECGLKVDEEIFTSNDSDDHWELTSFPGAYVHVTRQPRCGTPSPTIPLAIASQRGWEVHPVCYSMRFRGDRVERVYYPWEETLDDPSLESGMGHDPHPWVGYTWFYDPRFVDENLGYMALLSLALTHLGTHMLGWCPGMFMRLNPKRTNWWGMTCCQMTMKIRAQDG